ncbi:Hsp20/alpha crystallin family protein [Candidatus Wolfebacteria bacterium]|nr:Hsp20/alpha crystallin family protein [Candidatus Wolfebacteria bacterium]
MDKESKLFFEKLSGINNGDDEDEGEEIIPQITVAADSDEIDEPSISDEIEGQLTVDVYETPTSFVIKSAVAGVSPENLDISITNESVTIKGKREEDEKIKADNYLHQECYWGKFSRSIVLPQEIDPDKSQASLKNGILKISLPKVSKAKTKKLKVKFD